MPHGNERGDSSSSRHDIMNEGREERTVLKHARERKARVLGSGKGRAGRVAQCERRRRMIGRRLKKLKSNKREKQEEQI